MISTSNLSGLPDIAGFRRLTRALAMLDAIVSPEWEHRYYSFNSRWARDEMMASMRNGQGDQWMALLCSAGVAVVGLAHESPTFRPGEPQPWVFEDLPEAFHENVRAEPAFDCANSTFCIWRTSSDRAWSSGVTSPVEDGSAALLSILAGDPRQYIDFARTYYEVELALDDVASVYAHEPLSEALVERLNPGVKRAALNEDRMEIGYPDAG